ncbi:MAG: T9SS type A sorting domain-containing protein [Aliifodinibius sp.]|nr:T9SS type A sorting domain-containing protein [Fodinibius sp.]
MMMILKSTFLWILCGILPIFGQQFSSDIIIDQGTLGVKAVGTPVTAVDDREIMAVSWETYLYDNPTWLINYTYTTDNGETFEPTKTVDSIPDPNLDWSWDQSMIAFDYQNNPLVFYNSYWWPASYVHRVKKSLDGGDTFLPNFYSLTSYQYMIDFIFDHAGIGHAALDDDDSSGIAIWQTTDGGISFSQKALLNVNHFTPFHNISMVECGNGDLLCIWGGQDSSYYSTILAARSTDGGISYSAPTDLDTVTYAASSSSAAAYQNYVFVVYYGAGPNTTPKILFIKSEDYGHTFSQPLVLYEFSNTPPSSHPWPYMQFNPNVGICAIWKDPTSVESILFTYSSDFGDSFSNVVSTTGGVYHARGYKSLAVSDSGHVYVVSRTGHYTTGEKIVLNKARLPVITGVTTTPKPLIEVFQLFQNFPNPFNSTTTIRFFLERKANVYLDIFDISGRRIRRLLSGIYTRGEHQVTWDGTNENNKYMSTGIYFYRIRVGQRQKVRKMLLLE